MFKIYVSVGETSLGQVINHPQEKKSELSHLTLLIFIVIETRKIDQNKMAMLSYRVLSCDALMQVYLGLSAA